MWVWTPNSSWVNEARFGYDRLLQSALAGDCFSSFGAPDYSSLGFVAGVPYCGLGTISITGFTSLGSGLGNVSLPAYFAGEDAVSRTWGSHVFKLGGGVRSTHWDSSRESALRGTIAFSTLSGFLTGTPSGSSTANSLGVGSALQEVVWKSYWWFLQDDWRINSRVTVNLGLRWDYESPMRDVNNQLGGFDPTTPSGLFQQTDSRSLWNSSKKDFGPRLGVAWDLNGKGTTVLRASGGVYYQPFITQLISSQEAAYAVPTGANLYLAGTSGAKVAAPGTLQNGTISGTQLGNSIKANWAVNTPIFGTLPTTGTISCGDGASSITGGVGVVAPCSLGVVDPALKPAIVGMWNIGIQHAITNDITVEVSYVGNHGEWGTGALDLNQPTPGVKACPTPAGSCLSEQQRRPYYNTFPYLGQISSELSRDRSNYNSVQASLKKRISHGLTLNAGYTYGHALAQHSLDGTANPKGVMDSTRPGLDYGSSDYDYRQRFTLAGTYLLPGKKSPLQMLQGWQLNSSLNILTGVPLNAFDSSSDFSGTGESVDRWNLFGSAKDFEFGQRTVVPCWGVAKAPSSVSGGFAGGTFGTDSSCTQVAPGGTQKATETAANLVANMPQACITAAASLPTNASVIAAGDKNATGLQTLSNFGCYVAGDSVMLPPAQGTYGNMSVNLFRGRRLKVWDLSVSKNWNIKEKLTAQFRVEVFNVINIVNLAGNGGANPLNPSTFGVSPGTPDVVNSAPVFGTGGPRKIQLGAKFIF
jgi:hypothetical protein